MAGALRTTACWCCSLPPVHDPHFAGVGGAIVDDVAAYVLEFFTPFPVFGNFPCRADQAFHVSDFYIGAQSRLIVSTALDEHDSGLIAVCVVRVGAFVPRAPFTECAEADEAVAINDQFLQFVEIWCVLASADWSLVGRCGVSNVFGGFGLHAWADGEGLFSDSDGVGDFQSVEAALEPGFAIHGALLDPAVAADRFQSVVVRSFRDRFVEAAPAFTLDKAIRGPPVIGVFGVVSGALQNGPEKDVGRINALCAYLWAFVGGRSRHARAAGMLFNHRQ